MSLPTKLRVGAGLAWAQLTHDRARTVLAVAGIAFAVLSATLLASVGFGVIQTGTEKFDAAGRDLWITGGPVRFAPGTLGGIEPSLHDAHTLAADIAAREDVQTAVPMLFQTVYVGPNKSALSTQVAVGVPGTGGGSVTMTRGRGFDRSPHYADGTYSGPRSYAVVVDEQTAARYNLSVGDTLYVGGTIVGARENPYTVVGVSPTFSRFLGTPTVTVPLSELQSMTGKAHADQASMVTVSLRDGVSAQRVERALQAQYPQYDVRTNQEQLRAVLAKKAVVIASGVSLVVAALVAGLALTVNLLLLVVYQQRTAIAAIRALGVSRTVVVAMVAAQALLLGVVGGALGLLVTPPLAAVLDLVAAKIVGFEGLVRTPLAVYGAGIGAAVTIGVGSAFAAALRVAGIAPLDALTNRA